MGFDKLNNQEKIIFLAGVFDGEGSFGIWSNGNKPKRIEIAVEATDSDMVMRFVEVFGGTFFTIAKRQEHFKNTFKWKMTGDRALKVLAEMIPYMCLRRREKFDGMVKFIRDGV